MAFEVLISIYRSPVRGLLFIFLHTVISTTLCLECHHGLEIGDGLSYNVRKKYIDTCVCMVSDHIIDLGDGLS